MINNESPLIICEDEDVNTTCPICGEECDTLYIADGYVVGCDICIERMPVQNYKEEDYE